MIKAIPVIATQLSKLLETPDTKCQAVYLQASKTNAGDISFGKSGQLHFFIEPAKSSTYITNDARNIWVKSTNGTDTLCFDTIQE